MPESYFFKNYIYYIKINYFIENLVSCENRLSKITEIINVMFSYRNLRTLLFVLYL